MSIFDGVDNVLVSKERLSCAVIPPTGTDHAAFPPAKFPAILHTAIVDEGLETRVVSRVHEMFMGSSICADLCPFDSRMMINAACASDPRERGSFWCSMYISMNAARCIVEPMEMAAVTGCFLGDYDISSLDILWGRAVFQKWLRYTFKRVDNDIINMLRGCRTSFETQTVLVNTLIDVENTNFFNADPLTLDWIGEPRAKTGAISSRLEAEYELWRWGTSFLGALTGELYPHARDGIEHCGHFLWIPCLLCISFASTARRAVLQNAVEPACCAKGAWINFAFEMAMCTSTYIKTELQIVPVLQAPGAALQAATAAWRELSIGHGILGHIRNKRGSMVPDKYPVRKEARKVLWMARAHDWDRQ